MRMTLKCVSINMADGDAVEFVFVSPAGGETVTVETEDREAFKLGDWYSVAVTRARRERPPAARPGPARRPGKAESAPAD